LERGFAYKGKKGSVTGGGLWGWKGFLPLDIECNELLLGMGQREGEADGGRKKRVTRDTLFKEPSLWITMKNDVLEACGEKAGKRHL